MIERDKEYYNQKISELYSVIENQEKIIRDLQKQIVSLTNEKVVYECRNNKVIEYCENTNRYEILDCYDQVIDIEYIYKDLLEILKGEDNEKGDKR